MDFSKLKKVVEAVHIKEPKKARYELRVRPYLGVWQLITVIDLENGSEPVRVEVKEEKVDYWRKRLRKEYRPLKEHDAHRN